MDVQVFINNFNFPKSVDYLLSCMQDGGLNTELFADGAVLGWPGPRWTQKGDICLFHYAVSAKQIMRATHKEYQQIKSDLTQQERSLIEEGFERGERDYERFGGRIFAISKALGVPEFFDPDTEQFSTTTWADFGKTRMLQNPIHAHDISDYVKISRVSAITSISGDNFEHVKRLIMQRNDVPKYFMKATSTPLPLTKITQDNFLALKLDQRMRFFLEEQFRSWYVNYLLAMLGTKKGFYTECQCYTGTKLKGVVDNVIATSHGNLMVEVKLNIHGEPHLFAQLDKYCNSDRIVLRNRNGTVKTKDFLTDKVLVMDVKSVYLYRKGSGQLEKMAELDALDANDEVIKLRNKIYRALAV